MISSTWRPKVTLQSLCYNHERFVLEALDSVARQDACDLQWIIVDDGSADNSARLINQWLGKNHGTLREKGFHVEFIRHEKNLGLLRTLNTILSMARGSYFCSLSCDDRMLPKRLSTSIKLIDKLPNSYAGAYSDAYVIDSNGNRLNGMFIERYRKFERIPAGNIFEALLPGNFIPAPTVTVRTEMVRMMGGYDERLCYDDYDMWLRLSRQYKFFFIDCPLVEYRFHDKNLHKNLIDFDISNYWIYRKHIDHPLGIKRFVEHAFYILSRCRPSYKILMDMKKTKIPQLSNWIITRVLLIRALRRMVRVVTTAWSTAVN